MWWCVSVESLRLSKVVAMFSMETSPKTLGCTLADKAVFAHDHTHGSKEATECNTGTAHGQTSARVKLWRNAGFKKLQDRPKDELSRWGPMTPLAGTAYGNEETRNKNTGKLSSFSTQHAQRCVPARSVVTQWVCYPENHVNAFSE